MSIDPSLKLRSALVRHRSVLSRGERLERLINEERWEAAQGVLGLPKVRNLKVKRVKAKAEKAAAGAEGAVTAAEGAAPAAEGAAAAKTAAAPAAKTAGKPAAGRGGKG
jgi:small basic protein (TIGR04137 family)